jgi:glycosyltransferase involved in cell wall biosynthesis
MPPFFTVVMPLHNKRPFVAQAVQSVLHQSYPDFELCVVDDGSTDESLAALGGLSEARLRVVRQPHQGASVARNRGIVEARGEWIAFLDADDQYLPAFLGQVHACAERFPEAGAIYARIQWEEFREANPSRRPPRVASEAPWLLPDYFRHIVYGGGCEISASSVAIRREVFAAAGGFPEGIHIGEDSDTWLRVAWATRIAFLPQTLAVYRRWAGQSRWGEHTEEPFWMNTCREGLRTGRVPPQLRASTEAYLAWSQVGRAIAQALRGNSSLARATLWQALQRNVPKRFLAKAALLVYSPLVANCVRRRSARSQRFPTTPLPSP